MSRQVRGKQFFPGDDACDSGLNTWEEMCHSVREILITLGYHNLASGEAIWFSFQYKIYGK